MTPQQHAEQLDREGKCIVCMTVVDRKTRGLCPMHYQRFLRTWTELAPDEQEDLEALLVAEGRLLPNRRGQKLATGEDEFADALRRLRESKSQQAAEARPDPVEARTTAETVRKLNKLAAKDAPAENSSKAVKKQAKHS